MQKGTTVINIRNIFFITLGFNLYLLAPPTLAPLPPPMLPPLVPLLLMLPLLLVEPLLGLLMLELLLCVLLLFDLLMLEELLLLLLFLMLVEVLFLPDEELELGLTYSELERTCRLLFAGV